MSGPQQELAAGLEETLIIDPLQAHSYPALPGIETRLCMAVHGPHPVRIRYQALASSAATERTVRP